MLSVVRTLVDAAREAMRVPGEVRRHRPSPPVDGIVVEIGGGNNPHPRSDLVIDRYIADDFEREDSISLVKPLVVGDGHALPLRDRSAAYVLTLHVLEHATDPARFVEELARVAPAGFAQVPSREAELTYGWPFHRWLIHLEGGTLVFEPKGTLRAPLSSFFHSDHAASTLHRLWWTAHLSRWLHSVEWRERLDVRVIGTSDAEATAQLDIPATIDALDGFAAKGLLRPLPEELLAILACPVCRAQLRFEERRALCTGCEREFPIAGGVPILLEEAAVSRDGADSDRSG